jgi:hypothetical protein
MRLVLSLLLSLSSLSLFAEAPAAAAATSQESEVRLSLSDYETMRDQGLRPSATIVDTIRLSGTFRGRDLQILFSGRSIGKRPQAAVIDSTNDVTISGCKGDAMITRTTRGAFSIIPLADSFDLRCDLRLSGSDRLMMHVQPSVLDVQASVQDGELVVGDEDADGGRTYSLVRQVLGTGERLQATATGRYRVTLLPDASRFDYSIDVHNPNRSISTLTMALVSNEHLQQIDSAAPYEVEGTRYTFTIPPGDSSIKMSGELRGTSFRAPVDASLQYLVLESHPLIRPTVQTGVKRVSIAETGITPQYRGALAFESGRAEVRWQINRLEALRAISYAVNDAKHRFYVSLDGPVLGQTNVSLRNEGAAEVILPTKPEPTYVSLQNEPVLLTKDAKGRVTVPLSTGEQTLLVQHRQAFNERFGIGIASIDVPQLEVPATRTHVTMSYPAEWVPLYERFGARSVFWSPDFALVLLFVALIVWLERLLSWFGVGLVRRVIIAAVGALSATIVFTFLIVVVLVAGGATLLWLSTLAMRARVAMVALLGIVAFIVVAVLGISSVSMRKYEAASGSYEDVAAIETVVTSTDATARAQEPQAKGVAPATPIGYQGLPAKFELPQGSRFTSFEQELLRTDREQRVLVVAVAMALIKWLGVVLVLITAYLIFADRRRFAEVVRAQIARPKAAVEAV